MNRSNLPVVLVFFASLALPVSAQQPDTEDVPQVSASAWIDVLVPPKRAVMLIALSGDGPDAAAAAAALLELDATVRSALGEEGTRVIAWGYGMGENQQIRRMLSQAQQVTTSQDFLARAGLAVFVENAADIPAAAASLAAAGVSSMNGVLLFADEQDPTIEDAIAETVRSARRSAEAMAAAENGRLGNVLRLNSTRQFASNALARFNWNDPSGVPLHPGEMVVRITVQGTWQLVR